MIYRGKIKINSLNAVKDFVAICNEYNSNVSITIFSGRYVIDAKSIMGLFSIDVTQILNIEIEAELEDIVLEIKDRLSSYIVNDG